MTKPFTLAVGSTVHPRTVERYARLPELRQRLVHAELRTHLAPTAAQRKAGNYSKGKMWIKGIQVSIENPRGTVRSGTSKSGKEWSVILQNAYGYILGTVGADDGHLDCFVGPHLNSDVVFVVDQVEPKTGKYDESKVMLGWTNKDAAKAAYHANYSTGWQGFLAITPMTFGQFRQWLEHGDLTIPVWKQVTEHYARHLPASGQRSLWKEEDHPRGQPDNAGRFAKADADAGKEPEQQATQPNPIGIPDPLTTPDPETGKLPHQMTKEELTRHKDHDINNSLTPYEGKIPPVGSWRLDPYSGGLEQLQRVPLDQLSITESQDDVKNRDDYRQYVEWAKQGKQPPPITVIHNVHGQWNSLNRRRVMAAREAGHKDILAWVADTDMATGAAHPKWEDVKKKASESTAPVERYRKPTPATSLPHPQMTQHGAASPSGGPSQWNEEQERLHPRGKGDKGGQFVSRGDQGTETTPQANQPKQAAAEQPNQPTPKPTGKTSLGGRKFDLLRTAKGLFFRIAPKAPWSKASPEATAAIERKDDEAAYRKAHESHQQAKWGDVPEARRQKKRAGGLVTRMVDAILEAMDAQAKQPDPAKAKHEAEYRKKLNKHYVELFRQADENLRKMMHGEGEAKKIKEQIGAKIGRTPAAMQEVSDPETGELLPRHELETRQKAARVKAIEANRAKRQADRDQRQADWKKTTDRWAEANKIRDEQKLARKNNREAARQVKENAAKAKALEPKQYSDEMKKKISDQMLARLQVAMPASPIPQMTPEQKAAKAERDAAEELRKKNEAEAAEQRRAELAAEAKNAQAENDAKYADDMAEELGVPKEHLMEEAVEIHEEEDHLVRSRNKARKSSREATGLNAADIKWMENKYFDYSTDPKKLPENIRGKIEQMNKLADATIGEHDWMFSPDERANPAETMWHLIREKDQAPPKATDRAILDKAAAKIRAEGHGQPQEGPDPWDTEEFARPGAVEKYAKEHDVSGEARDAEGKWTEVAPQVWKKGEWRKHKTIGETREVIEPLFPPQAVATQTPWKDESKKPYQIGDTSIFFRSGTPPESGRSYNHADHKYETGISVYALPWANSLAGLSERDWYFVKGKVVGFGSDSEPLIEATGEWKRFHKKTSEISTEDSFCLAYEKKSSGLAIELNNIPRSAAGEPIP